jgi:hypothetical protein
MWPIRVKESLAPAPSDGFEQDTVPPAPTAGVVHDQPPGGDKDTKVMLPGSVSVNITLCASAGPLFDTTITKGTPVSGKAFAGPLFATKTSA